MKAGQKRKKPPAAPPTQGKRKKVDSPLKKVDNPPNKAETPNKKPTPKKRPAPKDRISTPTPTSGDNFNLSNNRTFHKLQHVLGQGSQTQMSSRTTL